MIALSGSPRDYWEGQLEPLCDIWVAKPVRCINEYSQDEVVWYSPDGRDCLYCRKTVATLIAEGFTVPDDDLQCIRIGHVKHE